MLLGQKKIFFTDMESAPAPAVPGYVLQEKLGAGSYAVVYRAFAQMLNSHGTRDTVAVKCIQRYGSCQMYSEV